MAVKSSVISVLCFALLFFSTPLYTLAQIEETEISPPQAPSQTNADTTELPPKTNGTIPAPINGTTLAPTNGTTLAPTNGTTLAPTNGTTLAPTNGTTLAPTNGTTLAPTNGTTLAPTNGTTLAPTNGTTLAPTSGTTLVPTNGTTLAPITNATTTTEAPPLPPKPFPENVGLWNSTCIWIHAAFEITIAVDPKTENRTVRVPSDANAEVTCNPGQTSISLNWTVEAKNKTLYWNSLELEFETSSHYYEDKDTEDKKEQYHLSQITYTYFRKQFLPHENDTKSSTVSAKNLKYFETPTNKSYLCKSNSSIPEFKDHLFQFELRMAEVQLEVSGGNNTITAFSPYLQCKADEKPHKKSKALLISLTVTFSILIIAAVVGYFFWRRRRANQSGYHRLDDN